MKVFGDLKRLNAVLKGTSPRVVACSGGVDSMLLATLAHRQKPVSNIRKGLSKFLLCICFSLVSDAI